MPPINELPDTADDTTFAQWILEAVDRSPDRLMVFAHPHAGTDVELAEQEAHASRAYNIAKTLRPDLAAKVVPAVDARTGRTHVTVAIHQHEWVAGHCVHGCGETL